MSAAGALALGGRLAALTAARQLAAAGYRVIAGDGGEYSPVLRSRFCREVWRHPPIRDGDAFVAALVAFLAARNDVTAVLPVGERYVAFLAAARDRLPQHVTLAAPDAHLVRTCTDKDRMYEIAQEAGVPHAPVHAAKELAALATAADGIGYPCIVKPAAWAAPMPGGRKAIICADRMALERALPRWPDGHAVLLVQRYVSGPRDNLYFVARNGSILASVQARVLRSDRADGTGVGVEAITVARDSRLIRSCEALLERLGYTGIGLAQFIMPPHREPSFLEIKPFPGSGYTFAEACGLGQTVAAIALASDAPDWRPDPAFRYRPGRRYAWTSRDLHGLIVARSREEVGAREALRWLSRAFGAAVRADVHGTWSRRDPLPTLAVYRDLGKLVPWPRPLRRGG
jgi:predicted ATP-grasp superfamily ATP-dependent carboligase